MGGMADFPYLQLVTTSPWANTVDVHVCASTVWWMGRAMPTPGSTLDAAQLVHSNIDPLYRLYLYSHAQPAGEGVTALVFKKSLSTNDRTIVNTSGVDLVHTRSRQIHSPLTGSDIRVVSDLIPTCLITPTSPAIGDAYGSIAGMNKEEGYAAFSAWTLQKIGGDDEGGFTRLYFAPVVNGAVVARTYPDRKEFKHWPDVLASITITNWLDADSEIATMTENIKWSRRGGEYLTRITTVEYWSNTRFTLTDAIVTPQTETIQYDLGFIERTLPPCLHGTIVIPGVTTTSTNPYFPNLSISSDTFAATSATTWVDQVIDISSGIDESTGLYWKRVTTMEAPT